SAWSDSRSSRDENRSMSVMPQKRRRAVKISHHDGQKLTMRLAKPLVCRAALLLGGLRDLIYLAHMRSESPAEIFGVGPERAAFVPVGADRLTQRSAPVSYANHSKPIPVG